MNLFLSCTILAALLLSAADAFKPSSSPRTTKQSSSSSSSLSAQRLISEFEASDFPLPTGEWPYSKLDLRRLDESNDNFFYDSPRFVTHIDDRAIKSLTNYYREEMAAMALKTNEDVDVLDLCSSWISHLPEDEIVPFGKVVGVGMNEEELQANKQLTDFVVQDLNVNPKMDQFEDASFDVICNVVSVDYLTKPNVIFEEMHRILRPGGMALMSFSNRCFPTKAVNMWLKADDIGRMSIVGSYFHYSAQWKSIEALDINPERLETPKAPGMGEIFENPAKGFAWMTAASAVARGNTGNPIYVVKGVK